MSEFAARMAAAGGLRPQLGQVRARPGKDSVSAICARTARGPARCGRLGAMIPAESIRPLNGAPEAAEAAAVLTEVFAAPPESPPIPADVIGALADWGGCVLGGFAGDRLVAVSVAVACAPRSDTLASLIAGVLPGFAGRGLGGRLKLAQRDWALARGAARIVWTYDPLVRRNAHVNLNRLGAGVTGFAREHYPPIPDGINAGDPADRLHVSWELRPGTSRAPAEPEGVVVLSADPVTGLPVRGAGDVPGGVPWLAGTPADIETLRRTDPAAALAWRLAIREVFESAGDRRVTGFTRDGSYVLAPAGEAAPGQEGA